MSLSLLSFAIFRKNLPCWKVFRFDAKSLSAVTLDEVPKVPYTAKPTKSLVILLAAVLGAIVGITGAFIVESQLDVVSKERKC